MYKKIFCLVLMMSVLAVSAQKLSFPILGGELSNSAATSVEDIDGHGCGRWDLTRCWCRHIGN